MVWYNKIKKAVVAESSAVRSRHSNVFSSHLYSLKWRGSLTALQYVSVCVQCGLSSGGVFANQTDTWRPLFRTEICTYSTVKQAAGFSLARWARGIKANEAASYIVYKICLLAPLKFINSETDMRVVIFLSVRRKILQRFFFFYFKVAHTSSVSFKYKRVACRLIIDFVWFIVLTQFQLYMCFIDHCVHLLSPAAFLGDIALDEDDLRMFKNVHSGDGARHPGNHTDSGSKAGIDVWLTLCEFRWINQRFLHTYHS